MPNNLPYLQVLREIDKLREKGVADSDPEMMKLRMELRDHLEKLNKNRSKKSVIPKLMSIKTVKFERPSVENIKCTTLSEINKDHYAKYALLGAILAIGALVYKWYRESH